VQFLQALHGVNPVHLAAHELVLSIFVQEKTRAESKNIMVVFIVFIYQI
jgi:hypothetical protein